MDGRAANRVGFIQISNCAANCFCFPNLASMALSLRLYGRRACGRDDIVLASGNVASSGLRAVARINERRTVISG